MTERKTAFQTALSVRYLHLLLGLEEARLRSGGTLPEEKESEFVEQLNGLWHQMGREEHFIVEAELSRRLSSAWRRGETVVLPAWTADDPGAWRPRWLVWLLVLASVLMGFTLGMVV